MEKTTLDPERMRIIHSVAAYCLNQRTPKELSDIDRFNDWQAWSGITVSDTELALWTKDYLMEMLTVPIPMLKEAAQMDGIVTRGN